jgi:hypothetical protein
MNNKEKTNMNYEEYNKVKIQISELEDKVKELKESINNVDCEDIVKKNAKKIVLNSDISTNGIYTVGEHLEKDDIVYGYITADDFGRIVSKKFPFKVIGADYKLGKIYLLGLRILDAYTWQYVSETKWDIYFRSKNGDLISTVGTVLKYNDLIELGFKSFSLNNELAIGGGYSAYWTDGDDNGSYYKYAVNNYNGTICTTSEDSHLGIVPYTGVDISSIHD